MLDDEDDDACGCMRRFSTAGSDAEAAEPAGVASGMAEEQLKLEKRSALAGGGW